jgi:C4-dicarboxylate transporter, DctQ subunit
MTLQRVIHMWDQIEQAVIGVLGCAALLIGSLQVIGRYAAPRYAISYAEEAMVYLLVWGIMIASSGLVQRYAHVRSDAILHLLPNGARKWVDLFNTVVSLIFLSSLVYFSASMAASSYGFDERSSSDLQFPMWIYYSAIPVGATLMIARYVVRLRLHATGDAVDTTSPAGASHH